MKKENKIKIDSGVHNEPQFNLEKQFLDNPAYRETDSSDRKRSIYKIIYFLFFTFFCVGFGILTTLFFYKAAFIEKKHLFIFPFIVCLLGFGFGTVIYLKLVIKSVKDLLK